MPTAQGLFLSLGLDPGAGWGTAVQQASSAEKTGHRQPLAREGTN